MESLPISRANLCPLQATRELSVRSVGFGVTGRQDVPEIEWVRDIFGSTSRHGGHSSRLYVAVVLKELCSGVECFRFARHDMSVRLLHCLSVGVLASLMSLQALADPPKSQTPELFAPGVISGPANDGSPTFTPDGKTLLFTRSGAGAGTILESHRVDGKWTGPEIASFSGQWNDQHPSMAPDGSYLVFVSTRPVEGVQGRVAHIWRADRAPDGWKTPIHLPATVNIGPRTFAPSVAADNTIYFLEISDKHEMQLYRCRWSAGHYEPAEALSFSTPATADVDPEIAPDQSFLVFASAGRRPNDTKEHLYVVLNHNGHWGEVTPLRYGGDEDNGGSTDNEPNLAPDGQTLYFSSDRSLPLHFPRTVEQAQSDLSRINTWDNGATNVWRFSIQEAIRQVKASRVDSGPS